MTFNELLMESVRMGLVIIMGVVVIVAVILLGRYFLLGVIVRCERMKTSAKCYRHDWREDTVMGIKTSRCSKCGKIRRLE